MFAETKKVLMWGFLSLLFIGCTTQPITQKVINDIGENDIDRFQYYTSANITLTATERIREPNIDSKGTARIKESSYLDIIIISRNTKGVLMNKTTDENGFWALEICFEENASDSDKRIVFKQDAPGLERNFYATYTDSRRRLLQYGNREFSLDTNTGERVYLKIKIRKSEIEKRRVRRVKGRSVAN